MSRTWAWYIIAAGIFLLGCRKEPLMHEVIPPPPPPPDRTADRPIVLQDRQITTFDSVSFTNRFAGARYDDIEMNSHREYTITITPENFPINNSPWYAFKAVSIAPMQVAINLKYRHGDHRYIPKISTDGVYWTPVGTENYVHDRSSGTATFEVKIDHDTLWVAGQELITSAEIHSWAEELAQKSYVDLDTIGYSRMGRPLCALSITNSSDPKDHVIVLGRQHPPEVPGQIACLTFLETICEDSPEGAEFRDRFQVLGIPLVNPDGVDEGHWRHNAGGVDLNRDWEDLHQTETMLVNEYFQNLENDGGKVHFGIDFHSTFEDVFYTMSRSVNTDPDDLIDRWLDAMRESLPSYFVNDDPSGVGSPTAKNWFYRAFGAPSVTYEVGDETSRELAKEVASTSACALMQVLSDP